MLWIAARSGLKEPDKLTRYADMVEGSARKVQPKIQERVKSPKETMTGIFARVKNT